jgi:hypothetical protein
MPEFTTCIGKLAVNLEAKSLWTHSSLSQVLCKQTGKNSISRLLPMVRIHLCVLFYLRSSNFSLYKYDLDLRKVFPTEKRLMDIVQTISALLKTLTQLTGD